MSDQCKENPGLRSPAGQPDRARRALLAGAVGLAVMGPALRLVPPRSGAAARWLPRPQTGHFIIIKGWVIPEDLLQGRDHAV